MLALQRSSQCRERGWMCKSVWKMNCILKVTRNHPYIGGDANYFRKMRRLIMKPLEAMCMMQEVQVRDSVRWYTLLLACSRMTPPVGLKDFVHVLSHDWSSDWSKTETIF